MSKPKAILSQAMRRITYDDLTEVCSVIANNDIQAIKEYAEAKRGRGIQFALANAFLKAAHSGDIYALDVFLNRLVGKVPNAVIQPSQETSLARTGTLSFKDFCIKSGYEEPYPKQIEMMEFGMNAGVARLLLGSRGYGKTDYVVVLGIAYQIYLNYDFTVLIVTKSEERNTAMLSEIARICEVNGVVFETQNARSLKVFGTIGKENTVSSITTRSSSVRGRHPDLIVMDDPVTEDDVSEATRKQVQRLYNELNKLTQNILIIGQPVHKSDLFETLRPLLKTMEVPHGSIPELDVDLLAMELAGVSKESISASYHLKVLSDAQTPFDTVNYIDEFPFTEASVAFIDPSFEGGDYTALSIAKGYFDGVAIKGRVWKRAWDHCIEDIIVELEKCNVQRLCFETNSLGDMPIQLLRQKLPKEIGVVGKKSTNNKHSRIMNAGIFAKSIFLTKTSDKEYIKQVVQYEYGVKHDDAPDSLASLLEWIGLIRGKKV